MKIECNAGTNNPFKYTDPSGHGALDWFKKIFGAFIGALVSVVTFGALAPAGFTLASLTFGQAVIFGTISGVAGGVIGGAITGGLRGAALGGAFGFLGGAGFGAIGHGFAQVLSAGMTMAVMGGIGLGLSYGTGGWEGLVTFGAGLAGGFVGSRIVSGLKGADAGASASAEADDEILYAQYKAKAFDINRYIMSEGGGGGGLGIGGFGKNTAGKTTVIGRVKDLKSLKTGERSLLDRLLNKGSPKENWKQNSSVLRQDMTKGQPIRDASPGDTGGKFLNAERNLLKNHNWKFDQKTNNWMPPE